MKTVYFEEVYGVDINRFKSIEEIDDFVSEKSGKPLQVASTSSNIIDRTGNVLKIKKYGINKKIDVALSR
jgi:hypothetical protein